MEQASIEGYDGVVILAVIAALLVNVFFLFRALPWTRPGPWRRIWLLAALASLMFVAAEGVLLVSPGLAAMDAMHQAPLFAALLATAAGFFVSYTEAYRQAEQSRTLSLTDALTGLANRAAFEERLRIALRTGERFAILYVDLDGFKRVNDALGHAAGDAVLARVGAVMRRAIRGPDMAARMGGDEFALFVAGADVPVARLVAERVIRGLPSVSVEAGLGVGASIGIATEHLGSSPAELLAAADAAMYGAKRSADDRIAVAGPGVAERRSA